MLPLVEAREVTSGWNATAVPFVEWDAVHECIAAYRRWQAAILTSRPPDEVLDHLLRHNEFAGKIPDQLLLMLTDEHDD